MTRSIPPTLPHPDWILFRNYRNRSRQFGDVTSAEGEKESCAEFGFPGRTTGRRATFAATSVARLRAITFVRPVPAKRSRASRNQNVHVKAPVPADEDSLGVFEFGSGQPPSGRLMRRSPRKVVNYLESFAVPPVEPLEVLGSSAGDSHELRGAAGDSCSRGHSSVVPSPAPVAKGFDMSLFQKPGEWKCETCLVKNPPGGDKCVSCETSKPGGATAASGSESSGFFAGSTVGGALFASSATVVPSPAPAAKGFDMSLFQKPGEWKCETCLVKNPPGGQKCVSCETLKPGAGGATAALGSGSSGVFAGSAVGGALFASSAPTIPSFTFGVQAGVVSGGGSFGEAQKDGASTGASPAMTKGFDMSLFVKPGEWKCDACLVRNAQDVDKCASCETPKSAIASAATRASSLVGVAGNSSSPTQAFVFGGPTGTTYAGHTAAPTPSVSTTTFDFGFGSSPGAPLSDTLPSGRISDSRGARVSSPSNPDLA